jgi:hypothetical protein
VSFRITGPGFYCTRDGRDAEVKWEGTHSSFRWSGTIGLFLNCRWTEHGTSLLTSDTDLIAGDCRKRNDFAGSSTSLLTSDTDLIAPWQEPVADTETTPAVPAPTPYHRTEQFRAETARMLMAARVTRNGWEDCTDECVTHADALIAALDKPQPAKE